MILLRDPSDKRRGEQHSPSMSSMGWSASEVDQDRSRAAAKRAKLVEVPPHVLRHTAAVRMVEALIPERQIADFLGSNVENVRRIYGKHRPDHLRAAAEILELQLPQVPMNLGELRKPGVGL